MGSLGVLPGYPGAFLPIVRWKESAAAATQLLCIGLG